MSDKLIQTSYHFAVPFVMPKSNDPRLQPLNNLGLLTDIISKPNFDAGLLQRVLDNPWQLQSIYSEGQSAQMTEDKNFSIHGWVWPGSTEAGFGAAILSGRTKLPSGVEGVFPAHVYIPQDFIGKEFVADIQTETGVEEVEMIVRGIGFGASCSCCTSSAGTVNFHAVALDGNGNLRNQSRPSVSAVQKGVDRLFTWHDKLFQLAGAHTVHSIDHKFHEIMQLGSHCGQKLAFDQKSLNAGSAPAPTR